MYTYRHNKETETLYSIPNTEPKSTSITTSKALTGQQRITSKSFAVYSQGNKYKGESDKKATVNYFRDSSEKSEAAMIESELEKLGDEITEEEFQQWLIKYRK